MTKIHPIGQYKSYPAYRPSGVAWLDDVPQHWDVRRLKGSAANVVDLTSESSHEGIYLALEHVESWTGRFALPASGVAFDSQVKRFSAGDVLFGKLRPYLAKVTCPDRHGVCVSEFLVLRPSVANLSPKYLERMLRSKPVIDAIDASTFGAKMPRADWHFIGDMRLPLPPLDEQRAIVRYLDYVDRRIRRYVAAKRRLIALLEEERQAVVSQAVTRGLDPSVRLRPSGVEWIGDVPAHWEVRRLKEVGRLVAGSAFPLEWQGISNKKLPFFKVADLGRSLDGQHIVASSNTISRDDAALLRASVLPAGAIVYAKIGAALLLNRRRILTVPACIDNNMTGYIPSAALMSGWAYLAMSQMDFAQHVNPGAIPSFSEGAQATLRMLLPPLSEQRAIVEYLGSATAGIDAAMARARRQVELVEEYRTRLVADVVTGKLDVREAAAALPEEPGEEELIDEDAPVRDNGDGDSYDMSEPEEGSEAR